MEDINIKANLLSEEKEDVTLLKTLINQDFVSSKKRIYIASSGSRGDVQPYIALGLALKSRGHEVAIITEKRMEPLVLEFGLEYRGIKGDPTGLLLEPEAQPILASGSIFALINLQEKWDKKFDKLEITRSYEEACQGAEILITGGLCFSQTYCMAEKLGCVWVPMILGPTMATSEFPIWALESLFCCRCLYRYSYELVFKSIWKQEKKYINAWRKELGLQEIRTEKGVADLMEKEKTPVIVACSSLICGPKQKVPADYPDYCFLKGFIYVTETRTEDISEPLQKFILEKKENENIVYLGFGSMPSDNPSKLVQIAIQIIQENQCKALLVAGWSQLEGEECEKLMRPFIQKGLLFVTKAAPHDWIFPRVQCIVHHCGVGTLAAALRSGTPQVPCPFMLDQPHNAQNAVIIGCALGFIKYDTKFSAKKLNTLIQDTLNNKNGVQDRARTVSKFIQQESANSLDIYCSVIEKAQKVQGV